MRPPTDAFYLAAILLFSHPRSLFSFYRQENYCHFREQSPEALHCCLPLMRGPLGTIGSHFMKPSSTVNGLSGLPPFAGNHDNKSVESGMAVLWHHRGLPSPTAGSVCEGVHMWVFLWDWKINWFHLIYSYCNFKSNTTKWRIATTNDTMTELKTKNLTAPIIVNNQDRHTVSNVKQTQKRKYSLIY